MKGVAVSGPLVAFLGPSLPADEARRILPQVELLPPICEGDLSSVVAPRAITAPFVHLSLEPDDRAEEVTGP